MDGKTERNGAYSNNWKDLEVEVDTGRAFWRAFPPGHRETDQLLRIYWDVAWN